MRCVFLVVNGIGKYVFVSGECTMCCGVVGGGCVMVVCGCDVGGCDVGACEQLSVVFVRSMWEFGVDYDGVFLVCVMFEDVYFVVLVVVWIEEVGDGGDEE